MWVPAYRLRIGANAQLSTHKRPTYVASPPTATATGRRLPPLRHRVPVYLRPQPRENGCRLACVCTFVPEREQVVHVARLEETPLAGVAQNLGEGLGGCEGVFSKFAG